MKAKWLLLLLLGLITKLQAQPLIFSLGDTLVGEKGIVSHVMSDESMWIFGVSNVGLFGGSDIIFTKRDHAGNVLNFIDYLGTAALDYPNNMLVKDGKMILVGEVFSATGGDAFVLVLDTSGRVFSRSEYGVAGHSEQFYDVKATADGGFVVTGFGSDPSSIGNNVLVSKFDQNYQQEWLKLYDLGTNEIGVAIVERPTGGYFVAGDQLQPNGNYNVLLMALDSLGNELWDSVITSPYNGGCKQMKLYQDQIVIVGEMATSTSTAFDPYIIRLNLAGQVQWKGTIPQSNNGDALFDLVIKDANTYFMTGYSYNTATANTDMVLLVTDSMGQVLETRYYGGSSFDMGYDIQLLGGNEVLLTGFSTIQNDNQVFVVKDDLSAVLALPKEKEIQPLTIAPNPTFGRFQVLHMPATANCKAVVYNALGQVVWQGDLPASHQLELSSLASGYYHLQLKDGSTTWASPFLKY